VTAPRQVLPNATYLVTRRCLQRLFLLRPSRLTNAIFKYVLALAARRFGIRVHAYCVLSNHYHLVVTDPEARLPAFGQYLDSLVARALNASLGRQETFWAPSSYSAVVLSSPADVVAKMVYVLANPVAAGLVGSGREWPGLWSSPESIGGMATDAPRPKTFFSAAGPMPERAELKLDVPPGFESAEHFRAQLLEALESAERERRRENASRGRQVVGVARVLAQKPFARSSSGESRGRLSPRVAAHDKWKRIEVLTRLVVFLERYRIAREQRRAGRLEAVFPAGTYLMRIAHGAPCAVT
jgi:REP element-mobilizing transposase RayT